MGQNVAYYFLDDDLAQKAIISNIENFEGLKIEFSQITKNWNDDMDMILRLIKDNIVDGLLFDWQLQQQETGFDSEALVQQVRRLIIEKNIRDIPIILCSAADNFSEVFNENFTGYDLFDIAFPKEELTENPEEKASIFKALAVGYELLSSSDVTIEKILGITSDEIEFLSQSFNDHLIAMMRINITHELAKSLLSHFILNNGLLINNQLLATRLGIKGEEISDNADGDWTKLTNALINANVEYQGVFSGGWQRWWMCGLEKWWTSLTQSSLRRTTAIEKVRIINEKLGTFFSSITPNEKHKSHYYWLNCIQSNTPIDTTDGILVANQADTPPWQDKKYLSIAAVTDSQSPPNCEIDVAYKKKVEKLKIKYDNSGERVRR